MERGGKIVMWVLTVLMAIVGLAYFPSISSVLAIIFVALAIPIEPIQDFWFLHDVDGWKKGMLLVALFIISVGLSSSGGDKSSEENNKTAEPPAIVNQERGNKAESETEITPVLEPIPKVEVDTSDYMKIDADVLFEYGNYFSGKKVVTVISAYQPGADIKATTENNDGYFYSLIFEFENTDVIKDVKEGDILTIAGTIKEKPQTVDALKFLETPTVTIENCSIIGHGEIAQELKDSVAEQQEIGEQAKQSYESEIAANKASERDEYIAQCTTVEYKDVERNPDNYDGSKIKIAGEVIQVSEGWLDSVTLRVSSGGNIWYVTYTRKEGESRILEGDSITCYGECDGVRSYKTVLGAQVTIPSLKMEYYD